MNVRRLKRLRKELDVFVSRFDDCIKTAPSRRHMRTYVGGQVGDLKRKTAAAIALDAGLPPRSLQEFLEIHRWDQGAVRDRVQELVMADHADPNAIGLIDETGFAKKGDKTAGVQRQYCGATGKIDNCQAGVFVAYASPKGHTLVDRRLYLPQEWFAADSRARWQRCGIPDGTVFRTKPQLAWEMIQRVQIQGVLPFSWVVCDEAFGDIPEFLESLEGAKIRYLADVAVSTRVWLDRPQTEVAGYKGRGRPPSRKRVAPGAPRPIRVDTLAAQLPPKVWRKYRIKQGEKGPIDAQFAFVRAVAVRSKLPGPDVWVVFRRSLGEPAVLKAFLSNAPADTPRRELVRTSGMRWPIETCFEEAKGSLGMATYQTRSWRGWHHHMTLVILAHHFLVRLKLKHKKEHRRSRSRKPVSCSRPPCHDGSSGRLTP